MVRRRLSRALVGKLLKKLGFSHQRASSSAQDERIVDAFKKISRAH